jgi:hypothetical protein
LSKEDKIDEWIMHDSFTYRYEKSLDVSIGLDGYTTSSLERLMIEEHLENVGFKIDCNVHK